MTHDERVKALTGLRVRYEPSHIPADLRAKMYGITLEQAQADRRIEGTLHFDERPFEQTWRITEDDGTEFEIDEDTIRALDPNEKPMPRLRRFEELYVKVRGKWRRREERTT
jgi:hypothetical protein